MEIFIPWRDSGCPYRRKNFNYTFSYYSKIGHVSAVDSVYEKFNRANARNRAVGLSKSNIFLLVDADSVIPVAQLEEAFIIAKQAHKICQPFNEVHFLNKSASGNLIADFTNFKPHSHSYVFKGPNEVFLQHSGGAYVVIKSQWEEMGGMDERFTGWGGEDSAYNHEYRRTFGPIEYVDGPLYSLYHPIKRASSKENLDLLNHTFSK